MGEKSRAIRVDLRGESLTLREVIAELPELGGVIWPLNPLPETQCDEECVHAADFHEYTKNGQDYKNDYEKEKTEFKKERQNTPHCFLKPGKDNQMDFLAHPMEHLSEAKHESKENCEK